MSLLTSPPKLPPSQKPDVPDLERKASELVKALRLLPLALLGPCWTALVLLWLWRWFIVPLGVAGISFWHSLGLCLLVSLLRVNSNRVDGDERTFDDFKLRFWVGNILEGLIFGAGWLVHLAMRHS